MNELVEEKDKKINAENGEREESTTDARKRRTTKKSVDTNLEKTNKENTLVDGESKNQKQTRKRTTKSKEDNKKEEKNVEEKLEIKVEDEKNTATKKVTKKKSATKKEAAKKNENDDEKLKNNDEKTNAGKQAKSGTKAGGSKIASTRKKVDEAKELEGDNLKVETPKKVATRKANSKNKSEEVKNKTVKSEKYKTRGNISKIKKDKKEDIKNEEEIVNIEDIINSKIDNEEKIENKTSNDNIEEKEIDEIGKILKEETRKKLPEDMFSKLIKQSLWNISIGILIVLYFIFLNLGFKNIEKNIFSTDLKVFSITSVIMAIFMFERAYKKQSKTLAVHGIEILCVAIVTIALLYVSILKAEIFLQCILIASVVTILYYLIKSFVKYILVKRKNNKENNELNTISKEEVE